MHKKVYISGMHSGQNPCAGVGIARSVRRAFPDLTLIGVDHWQGSSGLHDSTIDDVLLLPQWKQIDDKRHIAQLRSLLDEGNVWIPSTDVEVYWLSENLGRHPNLLAPSKTALEMTAKPEVKGLAEVGFRIPEFTSVNLPESELHSFLRKNSWQCWLKSPYHDARRITNWPMFTRSRDFMARSWNTSNLFLQRHVLGQEESIAFCALNGELLGAVHLEKRQLTPEGKTWAGKVTPLDPENRERLEHAVRRMKWSGGGEIEYVIDPDGARWMIECNPRFPAWIFGGAMTAQNLPARLVSKALGLPLLESVSTYRFFTRVVQEIPAKEAVGIPFPPHFTFSGWSPDGKKGKGGGLPASFMPELEESDDGDADADDETREPLSEIFVQDLGLAMRGFTGETPSRIHLENWTLHRFESLLRAKKSAAYRTPEIRIGYSVKTSPTDEHLRKARESGFYAECISQMEVHRALKFGFEPREIILNGPGKFWPTTREPVTGLHMLFCDSVEEFDRVIQMPGIASTLGFRMRLPQLHSRFGNSLDFKNFQRIVACVRKMKKSTALGFHFHMPSWAIGLQRWTEALDSLLIWCQSISNLTGVPVKRLDLGGGFFPGDLEKLDLSSVQELVIEKLPSVDGIYFEPGRALSQDGEILASRVLDIRRNSEGKITEVVVDACIAELPLAQAYSHRVFFQREGASECGILSKGKARILGRICMEDDILHAGLEIPEDTSIGDFIIFGDAGAYERTMSYEFGRG